MNPGPYIAGMGIVTSLGFGVESNLQSLISGEAGIGKMQFLQSAYRDELPVGEVKSDNEQLSQLGDLPTGWPRTALLSALAAREALDQAGWDKKNALRTGFISANTVGGMDRTENFFRPYIKNQDRGRLADVVYHECGAITELVAAQLGAVAFARGRGAFGN